MPFVPPPPPRLRDDYIADDVYVHQKGREVVLISTHPEILNGLQLTDIEQRRLDNFRWRLAHAWKEYDNQEGAAE